MKTLSRSWQMLKSSYSLLLHDKELMFLPLISGFVTMVIIASFFVPIAILEATLGDGFAGNISEFVLFAIIFILYFLTYTVSYFFNAAIISSAIYRMRGGDPTVSGGLKAAWNHIGRIMGLALLSATVGVLLRMFERRFGFIGKLVAGILGIGWTFASYLVLPVLIMEKRTAYDALKESASMLKKTWGEQLSGHVGFGLIGFILMTVPVIFLFFIAATMNATLITIGFGIFFISAIAIGLGIATLQAIFQAVLYVYARTGKVPPEFNESALKASMY